MERLKYAYQSYDAFTKAEATGTPLDVPTLTFTRESDLITPTGLSRQFARMFLNARFVTIKESSHMVMLERSTEFADLLHHFFIDTPLEDIPYCNRVEYATAGGPLTPGRSRHLTVE
ncbi:alpha/beta hydrolase [Streptomyces lavendulae]|uniref:alpha/beta fold hydrolase n=1 Tax=Streptomyces lavendulae TaxID=1914 RepID=UPI0031E77667